MSTKREIRSQILDQVVEAKLGTSPGDFSKAAADIEDALADAYLKIHTLKAMFDAMEEVPNSLKGIYDANAKLSHDVGAAKQKAYNTRMQMSRAMR